MHKDITPIHLLLMLIYINQWIQPKQLCPDINIKIMSFEIPCYYLVLPT